MHRDLEIRVRALEIGFAKLTAYAAGGAVVGGAAFQLVKMFMTGG